MQNDILKLVKELSLRDTKTLSQKALKLSSETGELASKALAYDNAWGDRFRFISKENVLDEVADVMLVALSIAYSLGYDDSEISSMMKDKSIHWSKLAEQDISDGKYPFEIHLTVLVKYLEGFIKTCNQWGDVKPIVLDLYHEDGTDIQVTTSTVIFGTLDDAIAKMVSLSLRFTNHISGIIREKIETVPWHPAIGSMASKYFESHATILLNNSDELNQLRLDCKGTNLHISRNALKPTMPDGIIKVMATFRSPPEHSSFEHTLAYNTAIEWIKPKYRITKTITEYAILDSNEELDNRWLGKASIANK